MTHWRGGDEVGVEDGDELASSNFEAFVEGSGLVAVAVGAVEVDDGLGRHAGEAAGVALDDLAGDLAGFVGGVVEDLDFEAVARVVDAADGFDEALDDELLVEDGELDGDEGELAFGEPCGRLAPPGGFLLIPHVEPDELVAMDSVEGEDDHDDEVGNQHRRVEGVPVVEALEGLVEVVRLEVVTEALGREEQTEEGYRCMGDEGQVFAPAWLVIQSILRDRMQMVGVEYGCDVNRRILARGECCRADWGIIVPPFAKSAKDGAPEILC